MAIEMIAEVYSEQCSIRWEYRDRGKTTRTRPLALYVWVDGDRWYYVRNRRCSAAAFHRKLKELQCESR